MPERSRIARGLVKQQTSTPSASACQPSANVPLFTSSVQTCCPIQWHGVERPSCVLQDTWQPARQSVPPPPKCRAHFPSKRFFLTALAFMFSTHNWCSCWKEKVDNFFRSLLLIVRFYCCFKPAAVLSEVLEFQPSPTLFSKSYYPRWSPAASGILYKLCQLTSVPSPLHEEFSALQRSGQFFLISSQKIRTWREQDERNNSKDFDLDSRRPETLKLTRIYTIRPLMAAGQRWFLDVWEGQLTSWRCWGR